MAQFWVISINPTYFIILFLFLDTGSNSVAQLELEFTVQPRLVSIEW